MFRSCKCNRFTIVRASTICSLNLLSKKQHACEVVRFNRERQTTISRRLKIFSTLLIPWGNWMLSSWRIWPLKFFDWRICDLSYKKRASFCKKKKMTRTSFLFLMFVSIVWAVISFQRMIAGLYTYASSNKSLFNLCKLLFTITIKPFFEKWSVYVLLT